MLDLQEFQQQLSDAAVEISTAIVGFDGGAQLLPVLILSYHDERQADAFAALLAAAEEVHATYTDGTDGRAEVEVFVTAAPQNVVDLGPRHQMGLLPMLSASANNQDHDTVDWFLRLVHGLGGFAVAAACRREIRWETARTLAGSITDQRRRQLPPAPTMPTWWLAGAGGAA